MSTMPVAPYLFEQTEQSMSGMLTEFEDAQRYMLAGNATFTMVSKTTGTRFTYKIRKASDTGSHSGPTWFVSLMRGPDNENDFCYMGLLCTSAHPFNKTMEFRITKKSTVSKDAPSAVAFKWLWQVMTTRGRIPVSVEIWHTGTCGRCGRKLTVPSSIAAGIGPECASQMGGF